ncbi:hypothetical protein GDO86_018621 [Hymenochirus boettgeri]|uniref:Uncharacterized protein n=1 Tax=Hymenochirus boettgeri TaxID=247094 RepID=A0A8T2IAA5_9PIPI|nr:hypothetical protein GDO86_018621 [Hymenochirus boettgeri]
MVTVRCKVLCSLDLHSCSRLSAASLLQLVEHLPRLVRLRLSNTQCDSPVLSAIGSNCQRLRELDISRCKKLSASSLLHLVYSTTSGTFHSQALRLLLLEDMMQHLDPENWVHALCFLLLAVPCLEEMSNPSLSQALILLQAGEFGESDSSCDGRPTLADLLHARRLKENRMRNTENSLQLVPCPAEEGGISGLVLQLKKLGDVAEEDLSVVGSLCPGVMEVSISLGSQGGANRILIPWKDLTHLTLHCPEQANRSLEEVIPGLEAIGRKLQFLSVQNVLWREDHSLFNLLKLCPNLHHFQAHLAPGPHHVFNNLEEAFPPWGENLIPLDLPELHSFSLYLENGDLVHPRFKHTLGGTLASLFCGCPKLENLSLWGVPVLLDMVFETVLPLTSYSPLSRLRVVSLCRSHVTQWGAFLLLRSDNELSVLDLSHCHEVTCRDYHKLQDWVQREETNVAITWE